MRLDLLDSEETIKEVVKEVVDVWGGIDVLVNNAGWGQPSIIEEQGTSGIQHLFEGNVMGTVKITFAVLPYLRAQRSGTVVNIGSRSAWRAELPGIGSYAMVKAAVNGTPATSHSPEFGGNGANCFNPHPFLAFTENLCSELAPFNIRVLLVEPGAFRTEGIYSYGWDDRNHISDYDELRNRARAVFAAVPGNERGSPDKAMTAVADVVRGEGVAKGRPWPKYLLLGDDADMAVRTKCNLMLGVLEEWKDVTKGVNFD